MAVFEGHTDRVSGALELANGRLLSWSRDKTFRLWNGHSGACLAAVAEDQVAKLHPEWLYERRKMENSGSVAGDCFVTVSARTAHLRYKSISSILAAWNADSYTVARCLQPDGTTVVTQRNGQVCILEMHHGNRRVSVAEAEEIFAK